MPFRGVFERCDPPFLEVQAILLTGRSGALGGIFDGCREREVCRKYAVRGKWWELRTVK